MAFVYYTESRLVPMFQTDPNSSNSPAFVNLNPQSKVETARDQDSYNLKLAPYVLVQVTAGTTSDPQPAWWPDGWILRKFLRKCLKKDAPSAVTDETFTGVSYGDYKFGSDPASKDKSMRFVGGREVIPKGPDEPKGPPVYKPGYTCDKCNRLSADHRVYETQTLRTLAQELVAAHGAQRAPFMFGILDVRERNKTNRQMVVAESGFDFLFAATVAAQVARFGTVAHHYVTQNDITAMGDQYKTCKGVNLDVTGYKFQCAAPKLVQYYAHNLQAGYRDPVIYMTEVAAKSQGIYVQGHTAESCDLCRKTIPQMFCDMVNLERNEVNGRYPRRDRL